MTRSLIRKLAALGIAAGLMVTSGTSFAAAGANGSPQAGSAAPAFEQVDSIPMLRQPHSWQVIDDDSVIVWATPWDPYLVELSFRAYDLKFAHVIGLTQFGCRVYAKFDSVKVGGFRYPIDSIYKMSREEARNLARTS